MIKRLSPLAAAMFLCACATGPTGPLATAQLTATQGNTVSGQVRFVQKGNAVLVTGEVKGLKPNGDHGFHVHEKGDCSSGDGVSAGGHFNPNGKRHGAHGPNEHHAGDLVTLKADANGVARFSFETDAISVGSGVTDVIGRGLIVHRDPDDYATQPTGNSGPRVACAAIVKG